MEVEQLSKISSGLVNLFDRLKSDEDWVAKELYWEIKELIGDTMVQELIDHNHIFKKFGIEFINHSSEYPKRTVVIEYTENDQVDFNGPQQVARYYRNDVLYHPPKKKKSMNIQQVIKIYSEDYRGQHTAPGPGYGSSMDNCSPDEDLYGPNAVRYYGDGSNLDSQSIHIIQSARNKPNMPVKIYRAIPKFITNQEKIDKYIKEKKYILQHGKMPQTADNRSMDYFDFIDEEIQRLQKEPAQDSVKVGINPGDWVTINRSYALNHGDAHLSTSRLLSKTVTAGTLYTDGNSVHEWGYNP